jgi:hypothetical protein
LTSKYLGYCDVNGHHQLHEVNLIMSAEVVDDASLIRRDLEKGNQKLAIPW